MSVRPVLLKGRRVVAALVVLCTVVVISSSRADASCGDYVMIGGGHSASNHMSKDSPPPFRGAPQCRGLHCSDHSVPPSVPSSRIDLTADEWAICGRVASVLLPTRPEFVIDYDRIPRPGFELGILRPPR